MHLISKQANLFFGGPIHNQPPYKLGAFKKNQGKENILMGLLQTQKLLQAENEKEPNREL